MRTTQSFPAESTSVGAARHFAVGALIESSAEVKEAVQLMVSELATNCIRHVQASFELTIERHGEEIRVEVRDGASGQPAMRSPEPEDTNGRGLRIVDLLAARWGVRYGADRGKTVWFTLTEPPGNRRGNRTAQRTAHNTTVHGGATSAGSRATQRGCAQSLSLRSPTGSTRELARRPVAPV
jgi:anti-sigma regulatory factor (Ser/Thr protein kinase)